MKRLVIIEDQTAIREMLEKLGDPYTRFMNPTEFRDMQVDTSGELTGVGIQLAQDEETNKIPTAVIPTAVIPTGIPR